MKYFDILNSQVIWNLNTEAIIQSFLQEILNTYHVLGTDLGIDGTSMRQGRCLGHRFQRDTNP